MTNNDSDGFCEQVVADVTCGDASQDPASVATCMAATCRATCATYSDGMLLMIPSACQWF